MHPEDREATRQEFAGWLRDRPDSASWENRLVSAQGLVRNVLWTVLPQFDATGKGHEVCSIARDITAEKQAKDALRKSEIRYRSFIELSGQLGWVTNPDGEVVEDIPSYRRYTGQSLEEVRGAGWTVAIHPDDRRRTFEAWRTAVTNRSGFEFECRIRRHDGAYRDFLAIGLPALHDEGGISEWIGACIDITDRKEAEVSLFEQKKALDEVSLFLHWMVSRMPEQKRRIIRDLHETDELLKDKKVLVVDDDMRTLYAISSVLNNRGMRTLKAENGERALELLSKEPDVDVVLMDIMMPVMDGYETMAKIRAQERFRSLPVIALTAKAMPKDREQRLSAGANDYMTKPVDQERLVFLLRVWLYR